MRMAGKVISTPYDAITYKIIGCAMAVHRSLGPALREDSYQRARPGAVRTAGQKGPQTSRLRAKY